MKKKSPKQKGKIRMSRMFQNLKIGDKVAIARELSIKAEFAKRLEGRTGIIEALRGKAYIVKIKDYNEEKRVIVPAIHLRKI